MCTIGLIDTDRQFLQDTAAALRSSGHDTVTYSEASAAIEHLAEARPSLVVCNFRMPAMDGIGFIRRFRSHSAAPVMFVSAQRDEVDEISGFKMGATDFQHKPIKPDVLTARVEAILRRTVAPVVEDAPSLAPDLPQMEPTYRYGHLAVYAETYGCRYHGQPIRLTTGEFEVLSDMMRRPGVVRTRAELIEVAKRGDRDHTIDERAVDSHIKRIRKKLKRVNREFDPIDSLYGIGYRIRPLAA